MGQATITGASYKDTDGDGTVDRIDVVYSADISGSTFEAGDWSLAPAGLTVASGSVSGSTVAININGAPAGSTALVLTQVTYTATAGTDNSITDGTNPSADGSITVTDGTKPVISSVVPSKNSIVKVADVGYTLSEAIASGTVTYTRTGGSADSGSPHTQNLSGAELNTRSLAALASAPTLVDGAVYTITVNATDAAGNAATTVNIVNVTFDTTKPTVTLTKSGADLIVKDADTETITATFNEDMTSPPTISIGALVTTANMCCGPRIWTYAWDVPAGNDGNHTVTVAGADLAFNAYAGST
ncbi:hypothetical protein OAD20_02415, partial [Cyclobacteriaceae bacterium]|nr:hypothetical protein [Cyclobacteriaceae bacterium]